VPEDWLAILPAGFDQTSPVLEEVATEDGRFELASVLAVDVGGGRSATLVLARDISRLAEQRRFADLAWLLGAVLLGLGPLLLLWVYLRRAFEPLDEAVDALRQLADGRTDHYAELSSGADEIGDIGRAIEVFRRHALALERNADLEARRRRRQARFIRRQMTTLSETLDEAAQASAMADLRQIEAAADARVDDDGGGQDGGSRFSDQLGLIGVALERMTARVKSQQQALSELIDELREALEMKTRLISLEQELDIARQMQQNVLPKTFPATPGFEIAAMMQPAREVGGDFYDIFQVDAHRVGIAIADVSGKGIPAAFFMLIARTLLKAMALEGGGPGKTLARLNDFLCGDNEETMFVTLFYGELDSRSGRFTYANGGHNHPFIAADGAPPQSLPTTDGVALAVFDQLSFAEHTITLAQGQTLVLYTDGVTEAFDEQGQMFGEARLAALLATRVADAGSGTAEAVLQAILGSLESFCADVAQSDDITLIVIAGRDPAATLPFPTPGTGEGSDTAPSPSSRPASHAA
jgi:sigma-B regulation protein RsbU (phosphoserine phosphatase)